MHYVTNCVDPLFLYLRILQREVVERQQKIKHTFFEMAFGSLMEVSCQMDIACDLGYIEQLELNQVEEQTHRIAAMLSGLRRKCLTR